MLSSADGRVLLEARSISKSFAGVQALRDVSLDLRAGEVHALVGENGAGKSTLIKIISGAVARDAGTLSIGGQAVDQNDPGRARGLGVSVIYQQPALFPDLSVAENIALTLETERLWTRVRWNDRRRRALQLLETAGASIDPDRLASSLSMPEQQLVEIAKALGAAAKIFIMDEPTAALTDREVDRLFGVIRELRGQGAGVIYISHRLEEIAAVADRVTVLRDGQTIGTRPASEVERSMLIEMMVGRTGASVFTKRSVTIGETALEVRDLGNASAGLNGISLSVRRGEILGIAGLVGAGRTEFAETIFGIMPADSGQIFVNGQAVRITRPADAIRLGIGYVPEDRRQHGVVLDMPITANTSLASLDRVSHWGWIDLGAERRLATDYVARLGIKCASIAHPVRTLSGGNQQKVALARWLATVPVVLILNEPTQGVDVASKSEIHRLMMDCAAGGLAIVIISSELPEILGMSDRIAVMRAGTLAGILPREQASQQEILALSLGHGASGTMAEIHP